jgi:hypothetical protein
MKQANQETLKRLAKKIDWKLRTKNNESWIKFINSVNDFMNACDKWQIHYLIPEKTLGKHKLECGKIVGKVPIEEQIKSIKGGTRKESLWIQMTNVEFNCAMRFADHENDYIPELRKKINNLAKNKDYAKYFIYTQGQEVI